MAKPPESSCIEPIFCGWRNLAIVLLVALAVRGGVIAAQFQRLTADPDGYRAIAVGLCTRGQFLRRDAEGPAFQSAYRPPLYPLVLAVLCRNDAIPNLPIAALHTVVGAATVVAVYLLARWLGMDSGAWGAALLVLVDPLLLNQSALVMTETLAALLTILAVASLALWSSAPNWQRGILFGATVGLCILCRPTYLVWLGIVLLLGFAWPRATTIHGRRRRDIFFVGLGAALVLAPWTIRNAIVFGRPIATTTHGGYTLLWGNNPHFYDFVGRGDWSRAWDSESLHAYWRLRRTAELSRTEAFTITSPAEELANDDAAYRWAQQCMRGDPASFLLASLYRWRQFFNVLPNQLSHEESAAMWLARWLIAAWYVALYASVLVGLRWWTASPRASDTALWIMTLLAAFLVVHTFYWTDMRMRAPLMTLFCLAAGAGIQRWSKKRKAADEKPAHFPSAIAIRP